MMHKEAKTFAAAASNDANAAAKRNHLFWMNFIWSKECSDMWSDNYDLVDFYLARLTRVLKPEDQLHFHQGAHVLAPEWVVAIRGTASKKDLLSDLKIFFEKLHTSSLVLMLGTTVARLCVDHEPKNVTVTGHSLGAAAGLSVTRKMAVQKAVFLDTHLFSPPFLPMETIARFTFIMMNPTYLLINRKVVTNVKDGISEVVDEEHYQKSEEEIFALMKWRPHLYVNMNDPICFQNAYYFRRYKDQPMSYSLGNLLSRVLFGCAETFHLIPVVILCLDTTSRGILFENPLRSRSARSIEAPDPLARTIQLMDQNPIE
ncbi:hypothetical protein MARPO_1893s0001 [Marchantia polymorpha]|uniref:Fungal lipase-like domain-containing protein n=2 Tax=Marchantia polymorpha TaxID=3197 RepID=A0A176W186_MARPO|nr:hypothetical protein AXG93_1663s1000 [Marchantia polymorpha subsp. ruderalis]PTQ26416.1 hypothetical protein MARPO_1893s0001 [Marchantia polymorpha]|eukprot:PTQ26416.1 hypothetical protein MARPO_1893s0001 [Marchantia polymorpha]